VEDDVVNSLAVFGFSQYEAKAYCGLLGRNPINAYELAKASNIPPSKIYETLNRLQQKGCVLVYKSEPILYGPVPIEDVLARMKMRMSRALEDAELALKHIRKPTEAGLTWSLDGAANLVESMETAITRSQRRIFGAIWDEEMGRLAGALRDAATRGVELQIAVYGTFELGVDYTYDLSLCGSSAQERLGGRRLSALVVDDREVIVAELAGTSADHGIWTKNPVVSLLATEYIKEEIMGRVLINELGEERYQALRRSRPELLRMLKSEDRPAHQEELAAKVGNLVINTRPARRSRSTSRDG
jgi:sugar-specific transcriptional regulator TrmB